MKHRIVTAAQMKEIERAGDAHGLPYLQMMENAGMAAYAELQKQFPHPGRLLVVCGKGNNGGDGFVIARAAPNHENPNLFSIGEGFGFFVFFGKQNEGSFPTAVCPKPYQKNRITKVTTVKVP